MFHKGKRTGYYTERRLLAGPVSASDALVRIANRLVSPLNIKNSEEMKEVQIS